MRGAIPPVPNMISWRGAQLKHRDNFTFTFNNDIKNNGCDFSELLKAISGIANPYLLIIHGRIFISFGAV
jgi:hypothetical protein